MAGVPQHFQSFSNALPTYDFIDIIGGTGYVNFYAGTTVDEYLLSNFTYYSDTMYTSGAVNSAAYALIIDVDFDVVLNRPLDVAGYGIVNVPVINDVGNVANTALMYVTVKLRKWDGSSETDIVSNDSREYATENAYTMLAVDLNIPLTHFKKGETLRLTILGYAKSVAGINTCYVGHDPMNRSSGWDSTAAVPSQLKFQCPVRLNL